MSSINIIKDLINLIKNHSVQKVNIDSLLEAAKKNKILLHVLRILNIQGSLRDPQESAMKRVLKTVDILSRILSPYDYAFFKLVKPVSYVPADVDLLVSVGHFREVIREVIGLGYRVVVKDPYCVTLVRGGSIVDLYVYPSLGGMVFIDGQRLLEYAVISEFNGVEVRSLESYVESLVSACHAVYKERIYTLNDFFTVEEWTSKKTLRLAQEFNCDDALEIALELNRRIRLGLLGAPYKIPLFLWQALLLRKFQNDWLARSTSMNVLKVFKSKRAGKQLIAKFTRETY